MNEDSTEVINRAKSEAFTPSSFLFKRLFKRSKMQTEAWKDVPDFKGIYQISNFGNLKSFKALSDGRILKNTNKKNGYFSVVLRHGENVKYTRIHRLVAENFIDIPLNKNQVNHIDGNKQNNHVSNLEWVTASENVNHSITINPNQLDKMIEWNTLIKPKKIKQISLKGDFIQIFNNSREAFLSTGVCARNILQVAHRTEYKKGKVRSQAGGFKWDLL